MTSRILSAQSAILPRTAAAIAVAPLLMGITMIAQPRTALDILDPKQANKPRSPMGPGSQDALLRLVGTRDLYLALSTLGAWYYGDRKTLGWLLLLGSGVVFGDGVVQRQFTGEGEWRHWSFLPVMLGTAAGLLGWLDGLVK